MSRLDKLPGFHPSMKRLDDWLDDGNPSVDDHVTTCVRCAARLEPKLSESSDLVRAALILALVVPEDIDARLTTGIDERLAARGSLALLGELLAVPFHTAKAMANPPVDEETTGDQ